MKKQSVRKTVLGFEAPKEAFASENHDVNCPFTGTLAVKNELVRGVVIKKDISKSATIEWTRSKLIPKYERYEVRKSRMRVHNPPCLDAQIGDSVVAARTRPISKTKHHVIIKVIRKDDESNKK